MMRRSALAFVFLLLAWVDASAHTRSQSFSSWSVQGNELDGVYRVDATAGNELTFTDMGHGDSVVVSKRGETQNYLETGDVA